MSEKQTEKVGFGKGVKPEKMYPERKKFAKTPLSKGKKELTRFKLPNFKVFK